VSQLVRDGTAAIRIPSFALRDSESGLSILTRPAVLERDGDVFRGVVSVYDGEPLTSWDDYEQLLLELTDSNDTDSDGLPDIVSLPEPGSALLGLSALGCLAAHRRHIRTHRRA
jgi:hypothetical protein